MPAERDADLPTGPNRIELVGRPADTAFTSMLRDRPESEVTYDAPAPALEISNAIARLHKEYVGRGPTNSRTTIDGELVVVLLEGGFTRAEQTLDGSQRRDLVVAGRVGLQDAMRDGMIAVVEGALGRRVRSFMSANDLERNLQVEVFVLEGPDTPPVVDDPAASR